MDKEGDEQRGRPPSFIGRKLATRPEEPKLDPIGIPKKLGRGTISSHALQLRRVLENKMRDISKCALAASTNDKYDKNLIKWFEFCKELEYDPYGRDGQLKTSIALFGLWWTKIPTRKNPNRNELHMVSTIRQAQSAIIAYIEREGYIEDRKTEAHSARKRLLNRGLYRLQMELLPEPRLRAKIEYSPALREIYMKIVAEKYGADSDNYLIFTTAAQVQYMLALRPSEGLYPWGNGKSKNYLLARHCFFIKDNVVVRATDLHKAKIDFVPTHFACIVKTKMDAYGKAGPRAMTGKFVDDICKLVKRFPPGIEPTDGIYSGIPNPGSLAKTIRGFLKETAIRVGLDPVRLTLHSFRLAAVMQMISAGFSSERIMMHGGWKTFAGLRAYLRNSVAHANLVAEALYNTELNPIVMQRLMYNP